MVKQSTSLAEKETGHSSLPEGETGDSNCPEEETDDSTLHEEGMKSESGNTSEGLSHNKELGQRGEEAAAKFLERRGFNLLDRNWSCRAGEVDIVAEEEEVVVFIEVKTRSNCEKGLPEEAVTKAKRRKYEKIAAYYLSDHEFVDRIIRFDVISILVVAPQRAFLRHHRDAFSLSD